jgi:site-specific DNA-methyltransferase (adenine-specific)
MGKSWDDFSKGQELLKKKLETGEVKPGQPYYDQNHPIYNFEGMIQFFTPIWKEVYRVLKPGSFGFIMCIPRQDCLSRMILSLSNAGFDTNFTSLYWTYASGFPKSLNISKKITKDLNKLLKEQGVDGLMTYTINYKGKQIEVERLPNGKFKKPEFLKKLEGSYGGSQVKPAVEVIIVVMKPLTAGSYINQALDNGKGITWLDDCRIPWKDNEGELHKGVVEKEFGKDNSCRGDHIGQLKNKLRTTEYYPQGRFPANLLVSDDVLDDEKEYSDQRVVKTNSNLSYFKKTEIQTDHSKIVGYMNYSRFFSLDAWAEKNLPFLIVSKASKREKNTGCEKLTKEEKIVGVCENCGNVGSEYFDVFEKCGACNGNMIKKKVKSTNNNNHPTVKPIKLMSYLITLGSRPGDVILDPFSGSGTTGVAAIMLNRDYICIEKDVEYFKILKARIENAHNGVLTEI